jgi:hypothetical protein
MEWSFAYAVDISTLIVDPHSREIRKLLDACWWKKIVRMQGGYHHGNTVWTGFSRLISDIQTLLRYFVLLSVQSYVSMGSWLFLVRKAPNCPM